MSKICDLVEEKVKNKERFFSFEFFVPQTDVGVRNLHARIRKLATLNPLFSDCTWGAGGSTKRQTIEIAEKMQNEADVTTQIHMTLTSLPREEMKDTIQGAVDKGLRNILCLRGDPPKGVDDWKPDSELVYAKDFIKYVRGLHGDKVCIAAAGYPEGHPKGSYEADLKYLKEKIDAGADIVITQFFYDVPQFLRFVADCRRIGINVPILPGIMTLVNYNNWSRMIGFCKVSLPEWMREGLEKIDKEDTAAFREFGVTAVARVCKELIEADIHGFHFYTLNLSKSVTSVLKKIGYLEDIPQKAVALFPWLRSKDFKRKKEIRPIFWSNRPDSYLSRTNDWDEYPNGPQFFTHSPAYGNFDFHSISSLYQHDLEEKRKIWGGSHSDEMSVRQVFIDFLEGKIKQLPWVNNPIQLETGEIRSKLTWMNRKGFLTINSQPRANGVRSDDPIHGWGRKGGVIYKKAYLEFFCSKEMKEKLIKVISKYKSIAFHAVDAAAKQTQTNTPRGSVATVTWGIFPNTEVLQPTVVDDFSFMCWKPEAFALWKSWRNIYEKESPSYKVLDHIHDTYYLVNIYDNDFFGGDIFKIFEAEFADDDQKEEEEEEETEGEKTK